MEGEEEGFVTNSDGSAGSSAAVYKDAPAVYPTSDQRPLQLLWFPHAQRHPYNLLPKRGTYNYNTPLFSVLVFDQSWGLFFYLCLLYTT